LHRGEQSYTCSVLVDKIGSDDLDRQTAQILVGNESALVVIDAILHLRGNFCRPHTVEQAGDFAVAAA
jgi:hypothetical protein